MLGALLALVAISIPLDSLIFFPSARVGPPPAGVSERWIETADGLRLHAWHARSPGARETLLWSHGNGGNLGDRADALVALHRRGLDVFAYDYRGYGRSEGRPTEAGVYLDAEAAYDALVALGVPTERIVGFGESLGGAVTIRLATHRPLRAVAVVATFTSLREVARRHYGPLAALAGARFDSRSLVGDLRVPIFIAHGDRDEIVPFELGHELFLAAPEPKRFHVVPGAGHNNVFGSAALIDAIVDFVAATVG